MSRVEKTGPSRRQFLRRAAGLAAAACCPVPLAAAAAAAPIYGPSVTGVMTRAAWQVAILRHFNEAIALEYTLPVSLYRAPGVEETRAVSFPVSKEPQP